MSFRWNDMFDGWSLYFGVPFGWSLSFFPCTIFKARTSETILKLVSSMDQEREVEGIGIYIGP
jgi:hypothetical protein